MSGICGYFRQDGRHIEEQVFADMLFLLERQGPDDQAYWQNGSVALGHTLLKTTRESEHEAQPSTLDGKTWLTADARIDGRVELIAKLHSKDVTVSQSVTDDHLILHAYAVWGADCLEHLIGDFAFILWDEKQKQLFCATDHMGVSPLYSAQVRGGFLVSNNLTAIRAHPQISNVLNEQAIGDYLMFRLNFTPDSTSFRDIKKLPAGHSIIVNQDTMRMQQYWSVPKPDYKRRTQAQYLEEFGSLFKQSVADRMRTDSIGTHLSGGMDSTSITAMLAELRNEGGANDVNAYTHAPPIGRPNLEQPYAEAIAQKLNIPLRVFNGKDRVLANDIDGIADLPPEPSFAQRESPRFKIFADSASKSSSFFAGYGGDPLLSPMVGYWSDLRKPGQFGAHITDAVLHMKVHGRPPSQMLPAWMRPSKKKRGGMQSLPLPGWLNDEFAARNGLADQYRKYGGSADLNRDARIEMGTHPLWRRIFE
ncbi:MAG: asparagine synthase-related protein, partial [Parasphingorhabdus sp.]